MESNGAPCYVIEYHATRSFAVRFLFFLFFVPPSSQLWNTSMYIFIGGSIVSGRRSYYEERTEERNGAFVVVRVTRRARSRPFRRAYIRARIARKGYEVNDRNTGGKATEGRGSVVEKVSRFYARSRPTSFVVTTKWQSRSRAKKSREKRKEEKRFVARKKS